MSAAPTLMMSWPPGQTVLPRPGELLAGKYRIDRAVASGGMAAIFAAEHVVLGQRVAVKVLFAESARNPETVERLLREARASARLQTAHVARVLDAGVLDNAAPFLVMEYLEGRDLGAHCAQGWYGTMPRATAARSSAAAGVDVATAPATTATPTPTPTPTTPPTPTATTQQPPPVVASRPKGPARPAAAKRFSRLP